MHWRGSVLARLVYKESWILLPLRGNKRLRGFSNVLHSLIESACAAPALLKLSTPHKNPPKGAILC